jgi:hypothetical protein
MVKVIISHKVKDYEAWRPIFDQDQDRRQKFGFRNQHVFRDVNDANHIYMSAEIDNPSVLDNFFEDPDLAEKMKKAGVISDPKVVLLNPA